MHAAGNCPRQGCPSIPQSTTIIPIHFMLQDRMICRFQYIRKPGLDKATRISTFEEPSQFDQVVVIPSPPVIPSGAQRSRGILSTDTRATQQLADQENGQQSSHAGGVSKRKMPPLHLRFRSA
jgi:hypothetical protein